MKIIRSPEAMQAEMGRLRRRGRSVGFVPTLGALHEGHLSLVRAARRENDCVVVSIFVNPTQFGPREDFRKYPRTFAADCRMLRGTGVDYVFAPSVQGMYPKKGDRSKDLSPFFTLTPPVSLTRVLCGKFRPGHFEGVATVVLKLFNIVRPDRAYFGQKDYQQTVVIRRLIEDLNLDVKLRVLPTVREPDGLALSSRNRYLSPEERRRAAAIPRTLQWLQRQKGHARGLFGRVRKKAIRRLSSAVDRVQYLEIVDPETLESLKRPQKKMVALTACFVGKTRLIDNVIIAAPK